MVIADQMLEGTEWQARALQYLHLAQLSRQFADQLMTEIAPLVDGTGLPEWRSSARTAYEDKLLIILWFFSTAYERCDDAAASFELCAHYAWELAAQSTGAAQ